MRRLMAGFLVVLSLTVCGCSGDAAIQPAATTLPSPSGIPPGIYTGNINIDITLWEDGVPQQQNDSRPFTIVFDENGRFLDGDGVPFLVGEVYFLDAGNVSFEMFARSITVDGNRIVLRFGLTAHGDVGTAQVEMTGSQVETITFDAVTGSLTFVRTQQYGGIASDGTVVDVALEGNALLER